MNQRTAIDQTYYQRRSPRGRVVLVRKSHSTLGERMTSPYMMGMYAGAASVGAVTGMAIMMRRKEHNRSIDYLRAKLRAAEARSEFGYPCGKTFTFNAGKPHAFRLGM